MSSAPVIIMYALSGAVLQAYEEARKGAHLLRSMRPPVCCALEAEIGDQVSAERFLEARRLNKVCGQIRLMLIELI